MRIASAPGPYCLLVLLLTALAPCPGRADIVAGVVIDAADGAPLPGTHVQVLDGTGRLLGRIDTGPRGRFRLAGLGARDCSLLVIRLGYETQVLEGIQAGSEAAAGLTVRLTAAPFLLDAIVVTASRKRELGLRAPASTSVVDRREIEARPHFTPLDPVRDVTGVDFASKGLMQHTFAVRGHRSAMSGTMLVLADDRYAALPVLGFNLPYLLPLTDDDVARIEIVRGPGAALYGPNSDHGVMHIITRTPFDPPRTTISLAGGERSVFQGTLRHGQSLSGSAACKLSAQYFRGDDWEQRDPAEILARDPRLERAAGEARLDWWPGERTSLILAAGAAQTTNVDLANTVGGVQARDWRNAFLQARLQHERWLVNALCNVTDSGDTYALRTGQPIVDDSRVLALQVRHGALLAGRHDLTYGLDARRSDPRTGGTLHGANEDRDTMSEFGAYLSAASVLSPAWDLIAALRLDYHDRIDDLAVSPRLGAVVRPRPGHALRLTWNRAFNSPTANDLFMDYVAGSLLPGMDTRLRGIPRDGFRFARRDGQLQMRSPLVPDGAARVLPADATLAWDGYLPLLRSQLPPDLADRLAGLAAPSSAQVGTDLGLLDPRQESFHELDAQQVADVAADERVITETFELGYQGRLGAAVDLALDVHRTRVTDFFGELYAVTPSVFLDPVDLQDYLRSAAGLTEAEAAEVAALAAGIPVGTVAPEGLASADVLLANRQGGAYTIWGADLSLRWRLGRSLALSGAYGWISDNTVTDQPAVGGMFLSVPRNKGFLGLDLRDEPRGLTGTVRLRAVESFPVVSGLFAGTVKAYTVLDLDVGRRLARHPDVQLALSARNVLDARHREFVGAPELGRLLLTRLRVRF